MDSFCTSSSGSGTSYYSTRRGTTPACPQPRLTRRRHIVVLSVKTFLAREIIKNFRIIISNRRQRFFSCVVALSLLYIYAYTYSYSRSRFEHERDTHPVTIYWHRVRVTDGYKYHITAQNAKNVLFSRYFSIKIFIRLFCGTFYVIYNYIRLDRLSK